MNQDLPPRRTLSEDVEKMGLAAHDSQGSQNSQISHEPAAPASANEWRERERERAAATRHGLFHLDQRRPIIPIVLRTPMLPMPPPSPIASVPSGLLKSIRHAAPDEHTHGKRERGNFMYANSGSRIRHLAHVLQVRHEGGCLTVRHDARCLLARPIRGSVGSGELP